MLLSKELKLYVSKRDALIALNTIKQNTKFLEKSLKSGRSLTQWSSKPETDQRYQELILTLRRILSKNGMLLLQDRPVSELLSMQRYMQYQEQSNLLQFILQDLTDKEIRNLQSLVQRAEKLSKIPGLDESCTLRDAEKTGKTKPKLEKDLEALKVCIEEFNKIIINKGKTV